MELSVSIKVGRLSRAITSKFIPWKNLAPSSFREQPLELDYTSTDDRPEGYTLEPESGSEKEENYG